MTDPIIQCHDLTKRFGPTNVLNGLDLTVAPGTIVGLLGGNGCGKSTLIQCLLGLLRIDDGHAAVMGHDPWDLPPNVKARLGYVPQVIHLYPWLSVSMTIAYFASFYENWDTAYAERLTNLLDIEPHKKVRSLSSGQLQRLAIVLALGHRPDLLILDEPAASLDSAARRTLLGELLRGAREENQTTLFSTHITSDLERVASHVAVVTRGRVSFFGELDELKESVKRIHLHADRPLPADASIPGGFDVQITDNTATATIVQGDLDAIEEFADRLGARVTTEDLNLEDILLEMSDV